MMNLLNTYGLLPMILLLKSGCEIYCFGQTTTEEPRITLEGKVNDNSNSFRSSSAITTVKHTLQTHDNVKYSLQDIKEGPSLLEEKPPLIEIVEHQETEGTTRKPLGTEPTPQDSIIFSLPEPQEGDGRPLYFQSSDSEKYNIKTPLDSGEPVLNNTDPTIYQSETIEGDNTAQITPGVIRDDVTSHPDVILWTQRYNKANLENTSLCNNESKLVHVPFCCLDRHSDYRCSLPNCTHLPIAKGHCQAPQVTLVSPFAKKILSCPSNDRLKVALNSKRKVIHKDGLVIFTHDHSFLSDFCIEAESAEVEDKFKDGVIRWWAVVCSQNADKKEEEDESLCQDTTCLRKCCPLGYVLRNSSCVCHEDFDASVIKGKHLAEVTNVSIFGSAKYQWVKFGSLDCPYQIMIDDINSQRRNIIGEKDSSSSEVSCFEELLNNENITQLVEIKCRDEPVWKTFRKVLIPAGLVVSCVFLMCTLMCHLLVAPLRDLHGLCLAAYMGALLVADASLFTIKMYSNGLSDRACITLGTTVHVSFLSTFMWLNVICFDIWYYVGQTVQAVPLYRTPSNLGRFAAYGLYAWGSPLIFGGVLGGLQTIPQNLNLSFIPDYASHSCWFDGSDFWETLLFFYGPIGVLLAVNTFFIIHTGLRLYCLHHSCCFKSSFFCCFSSDEQEQQPLHRPHLNEFWERFALFAILAFCWITELTSWFSGFGESEIWGVTDTINAFQGVFIFIIFLRSSKKRRLLKVTVNRWLEAVKKWNCSCCGLVKNASGKKVKGHLKPSGNVIFKERLTDTTSLEDVLYDNRREKDESKTPTQHGGHFGDAGSTTWSMPRWTSLKSKKYKTNKNILNQKPSPQRDSLSKSLRDLEDILQLPSESVTQQGHYRDGVPEEDFSTSQGQYYNYSTGGRLPGEGASPLPNSERNSLRGCSPMKSRADSIYLKGRDTDIQDQMCDIICQALNRKDPK